MKTHEEKLEFEKGYMNALMDVCGAISETLKEKWKDDLVFETFKDFRLGKLNNLIAKSDERYTELTKVEYETDPYFAEKDRMAQKSQDENDLAIHGRLY